MELRLEKCEIFSPNIEAKCLAKNEKKALEVLKQALEELEKVKHLIQEQEYKRLFEGYNQAYQTISSKHINEQDALNTHNQHEVYKTVEGKYVEQKEYEQFGGKKISEGINIIQNYAVIEAQNLINSGDEVITAAIRLAKKRSSRDSANKKAQKKLDEATEDDQILSLNDEVTEQVVDITGEVGEHYISQYTL